MAQLEGGSDMPSDILRSNELRIHNSLFLGFTNHLSQGRLAASNI